MCSTGPGQVANLSCFGLALYIGEGLDLIAVTIVASAEDKLTRTLRPVLGNLD